MTKNAQERFDAIKQQANALSQQERDKIVDPIKENPNLILGYILDGKALELHVTVQDYPEILEHKDPQDMTPLHHACVDSTGTYARIMTELPSKAIWMRDSLNRIPLDVAEHMKDEAAQSVLMPVTYPRLFQTPSILEESSKNNGRLDAEGLEAFIALKEGSGERSSAPEWIEKIHIVNDGKITREVDPRDR